MFGNFKKYIMGMGMHKKNGKTDLTNWAKTITLEKWLIMTTN
jgi:hypothetical protein